MSVKPPAFGCLSNVGCVRTHNEDSLVALPPLFAVADGMGGHAAGEVASQLAIELLTQAVPDIHDTPSLIRVTRAINKAIIQAAAQGRGRHGMGTTLTAAVVDGNRLLIAQVGDSRAYLLHEGTLRQLTRDHSYVGELLAGGHITHSEAATHPKRSVITRALGSDPKTEADLYELEAQAGDRLLICSDGLYGMVPLDELTRILLTVPNPERAAEALIAAARTGGGLDNISVIVVDIASDESDFLIFGATEDPLQDQRLARGRNAQHQSKHRIGTKGSTRPWRAYMGVVAFLVLLALLVGAAGGGLYWYASESAFLRTEDNVVVVYRGLKGEVLPGLRLEWREYTTEVDPQKLDEQLAGRLAEGIQVDSLHSAAILVAEYERQIADSARSSSGSSGDSGDSSSTASSGSSGLAPGGSTNTSSFPRNAAGGNAANTSSFPRNAAGGIAANTSTEAGSAANSSTGSPQNSAGTDSTANTGTGAVL